MSGGSSYLSAAGHQELPALTSLRFFAAFAVACWHADRFMPGLQPPFNHAYLGVDFFFILSGFIISHVYWRDFLQPTAAIYRRFVALRLARLWPAHIAVVLLFVAIAASVRPLLIDELALEFVLHLFLAHNLGMTWINGPSWSVSAEFLAYLLFPLQVVLFRRLRHWASLAVAVPVALLLCWLVISYGFGAPLAVTGPLGFVRAVAEFSMGVALWLLWRDQRFAHLPWTLIILLCAAAMLAIAIATPSWHVMDYVITLLMAPLILGAAHAQSIVARLLAVRPLVYLGEISYSIYLMHQLAIAIMQWLMIRLPIFDGRNSGWDVAALYMLWAIGCGAILFHVVEKPARHWLRQRIDRRWPAGV